MSHYVATVPHAGVTRSLELTIALGIAPQDAHVLDGFPRVVDDLERLLGYLQTRVRLACGAEALRPSALMGASRAARGPVEHLDATVARAAHPAPGGAGTWGHRA